MKSRYLDLIELNRGYDSGGPLYVLINKVLEEYGSEEKLIKADKLCEVLIKLLEDKGIYSGDAYDKGQHQAVIDILIAAGLIHNLFFDYNNKENWEALFLARKKLYNTGIEAGLDDQTLNALFAAVESQLGYNIPVNQLRPQFGTPTDHFATAVWITYNLLGD